MNNFLLAIVAVVGLMFASQGSANAQGCGYTQPYSSSAIHAKSSGGCGYAQVYSAQVSGGCGQSQVYSALALRNRPVVAALSAGLKQLRANRSSRVAASAATTTTTTVKVQVSTRQSIPAPSAASCPSCPSAASSKQSEAVYEASLMASRHFKGHIRGLIAGVRFAGVGWSSSGTPSTCVPRNAMRLVGDATVRGSDGYYRVRYWV